MTFYTIRYSRIFWSIWQPYPGDFSLHGRRQYIYREKLLERAREGNAFPLRARPRKFAMVRGDLSKGVQFGFDLSVLHNNRPKFKPIVTLFKESRISR